ncbi:hypothetical protein NHJ13734_001063 [Beauveria thailandica]
MVVRVARSGFREWSHSFWGSSYKSLGLGGGKKGKSSRNKHKNSGKYQYSKAVFARDGILSVFS